MTSWPSRRLGDLGVWYGGGTPSKGRSDYWLAGDIPWLSPKDMGPEVLRSTQDHITIGALAESSTRLVPEGAVAVVVRSGILERSLPVALVPFETTLNQDMKALVPTPDVDPRWVAWGLRAFERELLRTCRKRGTTVASIEMPRWFDRELPIPPLREQRRIVEILEYHLSRLDAADSQLARSETRSRSLVRAHRDSQTTRGAESWSWSTIGREATLVEYGSSSKALDGPIEDGVPVLRMGNVKDGQVVWARLKFLPRDHHEFPRLLLKHGDLLFNRTNSAEHVGKSAVFHGGITASFASYLIRVRTSAEVNPEWASMVINSSKGRAYIRSVVSQQVGQANVNGTKLKGFPLPVPSIEIQHQRVAEHAELVAGLRRLDVMAGEARRKSDFLRRALLKAAFSG